MAMVLLHRRQANAPLPYQHYPIKGLNSFAQPALATPLDGIFMITFNWKVLPNTYQFWSFVSVAISVNDHLLPVPSNCSVFPEMFKNSDFDQEIP